MRKPECIMLKCKKFYCFSIKMLVQHPTCKRWQTWKVCNEHKKVIEIDKFRQDQDLVARQTWTVEYRSKKRNSIRPVIWIGEIKSQTPVIELL